MGMCGNGVWIGMDPSGSATDPCGASSGSKRVFRGGSWLNRASYFRSANRSNAPDNLGFRPLVLQR